MNFLVLNKTISMKNIILALLIAFCASCMKDHNIYEVNNEQVKLDNIDKNNIKKELEFISLAHSDLFGTPIPSAELDQTITCYSSFNDKGLVEDMVIRDYLKRWQAKIPLQSEMLGDVDAFTQKTYKKFYHRNPNEYELWYMKNLIQNDTTITPSMIYYAVMTSDEYKFY